MKIFSIKNEGLNWFNRPIYCESANEALSYCQNILMSDADRALIGLKNELFLYCLGDIDFVTGKIDPLKKPQLVSSLVDIFNSVPTDKIPRTETQLKAKIEALEDRINTIIGKENENE